MGAGLDWHRDWHNRLVLLGVPPTTRDHDLALLAFLDFDARESAAQTAGALRSRTAEFFALATERAALMRTAGRVGELPWTRSVLRIDLEAEQRDAVFAAAPGSIVGPFELRRGFRVYHVLGISRCRDDEDARARRAGPVR